MTLGQRLAQHRRNLKLTQEQAAELIKVSARQYQKWETDKAKPRQDNLERIAVIYSTTPEKLEGIELPAGFHERLEAIEAQLERIVNHLGC